MPYRLDYSCPVKSSHTTKNVLTPGVSLRSGEGVKLMVRLRLELKFPPPPPKFFTKVKIAQKMF